MSAENQPGLKDYCETAIESVGAVAARAVDIYGSTFTALAHSHWVQLGTSVTSLALPVVASSQPPCAVYEGVDLTPVEEQAQALGITWTDSSEQQNPNCTTIIPDEVADWAESKLAEPGNEDKRVVVVYPMAKKLFADFYDPEGAQQTVELAKFNIDRGTTPDQDQHIAWIYLLSSRDADDYDLKTLLNNLQQDGGISLTDFVAAAQNHNLASEVGEQIFVTANPQAGCEALTTAGVRGGQAETIQSAEVVATAMPINQPPLVLTESAQQPVDKPIKLGNCKEVTPTNGLVSVPGYDKPQQGVLIRKADGTLFLESEAPVQGITTKDGKHLTAKLTCTSVPWTDGSTAPKYDWAVDKDAPTPPTTTVKSTPAPTASVAALPAVSSGETKPVATEKDYSIYIIAGILFVVTAGGSIFAVGLSGPKENTKQEVHATTTSQQSTARPTQAATVAIAHLRSKNPQRTVQPTQVRATVPAPKPAVRTTHIEGPKPLSATTQKLIENAMRQEQGNYFGSHPGPAKWIKQGWKREEEAKRRWYTEQIRHRQGE